MGIHRSGGGGKRRGKRTLADGERKEGEEQGPSSVSPSPPPTDRVNHLLTYYGISAVRGLFASLSGRRPALRGTGRCVGCWWGES